MTGARMNIIGALGRPAEVAFAKFARGAMATREEARLAMAMAIIADTPKADLDALLHNFAMMIASRPAAEQLTAKLSRSRQ